MNDVSIIITGATLLTSRYIFGRIVGGGPIKDFREAVLLTSRYIFGRIAVGVSIFDYGRHFHDVPNRAIRNILVSHCYAEIFAFSVIIWGYLKQWLNCTSGRAVHLGSTKCGRGNIHFLDGMRLVSWFQMKHGW